MKLKDLKLTLNVTLLNKARKKAQFEFKLNKCHKTLLMQIVMILAFYKKWKDHEVIYAISRALDYPSQTLSENTERKTIAICEFLLTELKNKWCFCAKSASKIINIAMGLYIQTPLSEYTSNIKPLHTMVGYKNQTMQKAVAHAVENMHLHYADTIFVDACCGTGSLFWGLNTYQWKAVILNDLNPERTNFLNVILHEPWHLIFTILEEGIDQSDTDKTDIRRANLKKYRQELQRFKEEAQKNAAIAKKSIKVDCNISIAAYTFLRQCLSKEHMENSDDILEKLARILCAHLKLLNSNVKITIADATHYLKPRFQININHQILTVDTNRLVIFDPPYIGSEETCNVADCNYSKFHEQVGKLLQKAEFTWLYHCRSTAPKSSNIFSNDEWQKILKNELGHYFFNRNLYYEKIHLNTDTELIISNRLYNSEKQNLWTNDAQVIK